MLLQYIGAFDYGVITIEPIIQNHPYPQMTAFCQTAKFQHIALNMGLNFMIIDYNIFIR